MKKVNPSEIGVRIANRREDLHMNQKKLANKTGLACSIISSAEKGVSVPSASSLAALADALQCSVDYLLFGTDGKTEEVLDPESKELLSIYRKLDRNDRDDILYLARLKIKRYASAFFKPGKK